MFFLLLLLNAPSWAQVKLPQGVPQEVSVQWEKMLDIARSPLSHSFEDVVKELEQTQSIFAPQDRYLFYLEGLSAIRSIKDSILRSESATGRELQTKFLVTSLILGLDDVIRSLKATSCLAPSAMESTPPENRDVCAEFSLEMLRLFESRLRLISSPDVKLAVYLECLKFFERGLIHSPRSANYVFSLGFLGMSVRDALTSEGKISEELLNDLKRTTRYVKKEVRRTAGLNREGRWEQRIIPGGIHLEGGDASLVLVCYSWNPDSRPSALPRDCQHYRVHIKPKEGADLGIPLTRETFSSELFEEIETALSAEIESYKRENKPKFRRVRRTDEERKEILHRPFRWEPMVVGMAVGAMSVATVFHAIGKGDPKFFHDHQGPLAISYAVVIPLTGIVFDHGFSVLTGKSWETVNIGPISEEEYDRDLRRLKHREKRIAQAAKQAFVEDGGIRVDFQAEDFSRAYRAITAH